MYSSKINFVIDCSDTALEEYLHVKKTDGASLFVRGDLNWCLQTYQILKERTQLQLTCSNRLEVDCINVIHSDTLLTLKGTSSHFIVCVKADYPKRLWAHYHIVQNKNQVSGAACYIPHWIQPGLVKRNASCNSRFVVAYAGQPSNGNMAGTTDTWQRLLKPYDIDFRILTAGSWHNLKDVDVLLGIRSFDKRSYNSKPPTKLFNAWHAEVPFIGGNDSAYKQVGTPGVDYLLATTPEEAVHWIIALRNNYEYYTDIVENGKRMAKKYDEIEIALCWERALNGLISERYKRWQQSNFYEKVLFNFKVGLSGPENYSKQLLKRVIRFCLILSKPAL